METEKIRNIILDYCQGHEHLEFSKSELPDMIHKIKQAILNELEDAEHLGDTDTPRTDQILEDAPLRLCGESAREAFEMMYRHAQELERENNEMTAKQIELVNHLKLYSAN